MNDDPLPATSDHALSAKSDDPLFAASPDAAPSGAALDRSATAWLQAVLWGALIVPLVAFGTTAIWAYDRAYRDAESTVSHASSLALRQAERTFAIAHDVAVRVDRFSAGPDADVRAHEADVHRRLTDIAAGLPSVVNLNVWDADGHPLVGSDVHPVNATTSIADRAYFIAHRDARDVLGVSEVLTGRQTGHELVNVTIRRDAGQPDFRGIVAVSLSPDFFRDYYRSLVSESPDLASFAMVRTDGSIIARWPAPADGRTKVDPDNPMFGRIANGVDAGIVTVEAKNGRAARLVSFRRVAGLPVYVTAGVSRSAMVAGWLRFVASLAAIFVPVTLGLLYVSWVALQKTRREQALSAEVRDEMRRRAQAERAALESQKLEALAHLTGGVAHDFNNLLAIVSNNLHILERHHPAVARTRQLASMNRAVQSGVRLTRQLLSFSRKQALKPETIELQRWLPATEGLIRSSVGSRTTLAFDVAPDTRPIIVDVAELELALINTAVNARHAMPVDGTLRVTARNVGGERGDERGGDRDLVVVQVEDDGSGIAPALLPRVFEPFFTTKEPGKGSGLGLSQVAGLCDQAGGYATVDSTPGHGTRIGMYFPAAAANAVVVDAIRPSARLQLAGNVLLVEDNDDVAAVTEQLLRVAGLDVARVADADAALLRIESGHTRLDVVVSDISMPGSIDGIELAFRVRRDWPALPVLLMTGYAERINEAAGAGLRVLSKPVPPDQILDEIATMLDARTRRRATALEDA